MTNIKNITSPRLRPTGSHDKDPARPVPDEVASPAMSSRVAAMTVGRTSDPSPYAWPPGRGPAGITIVAGTDLIHRLGSADPAASVEHPMRVRPRIPGWPRGEFEVLATPLLAVAPEDAAATFAMGLTEWGLLSWLDEATLGVALSADSPAWQDPTWWEFLDVVARARHTPPITWGVGLLGYGAIGAEHARAVADTPGLTLVAVCDPNPTRVAAAQAGAHGLRAQPSPEALFADPDVQILVVSTPPDSHAHWAMLALEAGCHVVVEKPMAMTSHECDELLACAARLGLSATVYQNRRFDPDYVLIKEAVTSGLIGDVFHVETFVGGYSHPCNYWHSDSSISGGALFDWGSHVIDQVLDLVPGDVVAVSALNHKRVWHDVTNADHARMTLIFDGGREATFIYSDLAAALKPRWYILGTHGALTGEWRRESIISRNSIGTMDEDRLVPADAPPRVSLHTTGGDVTALMPQTREPHPFHADLVLSLTYGLPARVRGEQSRRVVAMLEAAEESARLGGIPVAPA